MSPMNETKAAMFGKAPLPGWMEKILAWAVIGVLTMVTTMAVVQAKVDNIDKRVTQHEVEQVNHEREDIADKAEFRKQTVTHDQFDQFQQDLVSRLDRIDNKLDNGFSQRQVIRSDVKSNGTQIKVIGEDVDQLNQRRTSHWYNKH